MILDPRTEPERAILAGHRRLVDTLHELVRGVEGPDGQVDVESLRAVIAFLRQSVLPFARGEERALADPAERERVALEHAFIHSEIDRLTRRAEPLLQVPLPEFIVRCECSADVLRSLYRLEAALELHALAE